MDKMQFKHNDCGKLYSNSADWQHCIHHKKQQQKNNNKNPRKLNVIFKSAKIDS